MPLEIKTTFFGDGSESQFILKRLMPDGILHLIIVAPGGEQSSYPVNPVRFLEGIKTIFPDLIIQLPNG